MAMETGLLAVDPLLDSFDAICRHGTRSTGAGRVLIEHDARAAASCTYSHMLAEADRRLPLRAHVVPQDVNGLKVWIVGADAVVRFQRVWMKMASREAIRKQARAFDAGKTLPGLPVAGHLTVGYWLDPTQTQYIRTQIAKPHGRLHFLVGASRYRSMIRGPVRLGWT